MSRVKGFSLLSVLVYCAALAILAGILMRSFVGVHTGVYASLSRLSKFVALNAAAEDLSQDLRIMLTESGVWGCEGNLLRFLSKNKRIKWFLQKNKIMRIYQVRADWEVFWHKPVASTVASNLSECLFFIEGDQKCPEGLSFHLKSNSCATETKVERFIARRGDCNETQG